jgi:hypothetical protein
MNIFWKIAENKISEWLNKPEEEKQKAAPVVSIKESKPYESYVLEDIFKLIDESADKLDDERDILLKKAYDMEVKLLMSYENSGFPLMARATSERIQKYKASVFSSLS